MDLEEEICDGRWIDPMCSSHIMIIKIEGFLATMWIGEEMILLPQGMEKWAILHHLFSKPCGQRITSSPIHSH
jgi:hypothetical protein